MGLIIANGDLVLPKTSGVGRRVDPAAPTFPWADLQGFQRTDTGGPNAPTLSTFRGGLVREFSYVAADKCDTQFHIQHDYVPGTDIFAHIHWAHNGTAISGNLVVTLSSTYAKGHNQAAYPAEKAVTITYNTVDIATTPRWQHRIDEVVISSAGGSATLWDNALFEPDGILLLNMTVTTLPTITGGSPNAVFIDFVDLHYQSTGEGTKQKAPNFYV